MEKKTYTNIPKGLILLMIIFAVIVTVIYFGVIRKDSDLHGSDDTILQTTEKTEEGSTVTPDNNATPVPGLSTEISKLFIAEKADVIFLVVEGGDKAECTFRAFTRSGGSWKQEFQVPGFIGKNGVNYDRRREGDYTTPGGVYPMKECFGILDAPEGLSLDYTKITKAHYWDGDQRSPYYNTMVDSGKMFDGWNRGAGEHLIEYTEQYRYCMNVGFNCDPAVPGVGFAIFLHCTREGMKNTGGCIAIPVEQMVKCLEMATENTYIIILKDEAHISKAEEIINK